MKTIDDGIVMQMRQDRRLLLEEFTARGVNVNKPGAIRCPFHEDKHASAGIYRDTDGVWRFKCHVPTCAVGGDLFDLREKWTGKSAAEQFAELRGKMHPEKKPRREFDTIADLLAAHPDCVKHFIYTNPDTAAAELVVLRIETIDGKRFIQAHPEGGKIVESAPPKPWPIYNRRRLRESHNVLVVEGEKCVHSLHDAGFVATTSPAGAGKAPHADWAPMAGKLVLLWPDNDEPGLAHMREVAGILRELEPPCRLFWIDPAAAGIPHKGDAADISDPAEIRRIIDTARPMGAAGEVRQLLEKTINGEHAAVPFKSFPTLTKLTQALIGGTITMIVGDPGAAKSYFMLQCFAEWSEEYPVYAYTLEDDRAFHLRRVLAQRDGNAELTDLAWVKGNPNDALAAWESHAEFLDEIGRRIHDAPNTSPTYDDVLAWIRQKCSAGARIIILDPVTAIDAGRNCWESDKKFIAEVKPILAAHNTSLVCITHPRGGKRGTNRLDDLAGGRAWGRFCQTAIWIERRDDPEPVRVKTAVGDSDYDASHLVTLEKTRNGRGAGAALAFNLDPQTLRFREYGLKVRKQ